MSSKLRIRQWVWIWVHLAICVVADIDPVIIEGSKFFYQTNASQFFVKGIKYGDFSPWNATTVIDPLGDEISCARDIPHLVKLGVNTIFVEELNSRKDHSGCMRQFQKAGIYVNVRWDGEVRFRWHGQLQTEWDGTLFQGLLRLIDNLQSFPNLLAFSIEMDDFMDTEMSELPKIKLLMSVARDHMREKSYRNIPIGVIGLDHEKSTLVLDFMKCGARDESPDFASLTNPLAQHETYWCTNPSKVNNDLETTYAKYDLPLLYVFYSCPANSPAIFDKIRLLYNNLSHVFSGAFVDNWIAPENGEGLVELNSSVVTYQLPFTALSSQFAAVRPTATELSSYTPSINSPTPCSSLVLRKGIDTTANFRQPTINISAVLPPRPNPHLCSCMTRSITCHVDPQADMESTYGLLKRTCTWHEQNICRGVTQNATEGRYGSYSMCNLGERASWVLERLFLMDNETKQCPDNGGSLNLHASTPTSTPGYCSELLRQAGPQGTGLVTLNPKLDAVLPKDEGGSKGLDTGKKVAIGLCVALIVIITSFFCLCMRRKRQREKIPARLRVRSEFSGTTLPISGSELKELDAERRTEVVEVNGDDVFVELPTAMDTNFVEYPYTKDATRSVRNAPIEDRGSSEHGRTSKHM